MRTIKNAIYFTNILFIVVIFSFNNVYGYSYCRCDKKQSSPEEKFKHAFAVFTGEVTKIERMLTSSHKLIYFSVIDSWKGAKKEHFVVKTGINDILSLLNKQITCGVPFKKGKKYIVISYIDHTHRGVTYTSNCGNVVPFDSKEKFDDYIAVFGKAKWHFPKKNIKHINVNDIKNMDPIFQKSLEGFNINKKSNIAN